MKSRLTDTPRTDVTYQGLFQDRERRSNCQKPTTIRWRTAKEDVRDGPYTAFDSAAGDREDDRSLSK